MRLSFSGLKAEEKWISCCKAAVDCCVEMLESSDLNDAWNSIPNLAEQQEFTTAPHDNFSTSATYCPPSWDGWTCWQKTIPKRVALAQCPHYIYFETEPPACARKKKILLFFKLFKTLSSFILIFLTS